MSVPAALATTRRSLHGVGEGLIAGPQYREHGTIRLRVLSGGFGGVRTEWRVDGIELVNGTRRFRLQGTFGELAAAAGLEFGAPVGLYDDTSGCTVDDQVEVDPEAAAYLEQAFALADAGLRVFAPDQEPVLWPEHFDLGISIDEINYGMSPGDALIPDPYTYVGPWQVPDGPFWNVPFGAAKPIAELPDAAAVAAFFAEGQRLAVPS